ncbi:MAG: HypC/HybG/HupF family hydrogenase formation chaperone [Pseudomonadota bacterium]
MCLALPARILSTDGTSATAEIDGVRIALSLALLNEVTVGDYVIVHVGFALSKLDQKEAERMLQLLREAAL